MKKHKRNLDNMTGIHDDVETYEPKVNMGYEGSIPKIDNSFDDITDDKGNINIIINSEVIGQTLAKKIYTSWESAVRELYNNEARACRTAKKMGANPSITITINPNHTSKQFVIQGVDSLGITKAMFAKVLRVIGTSGNLDGEEIGQFGMGFISYALLTDAVLLETWARETEEHYSMLCDSGLKFKPIPITKSNDMPDMTDYGTRLTMTCNDDVDFHSMVECIKKLARFSNIPTTILLLDDVEGSYSYRRNNTIIEKGIIECKSYENGMEMMKDKDNFKEQYMNKNGKNKLNGDNQVLLYDEITIDTEDYRFDGIMLIQKTQYGAVHIMNNGSRSQTFLAGTNVDSSIDVKGFYDYTINIKNERKYSPVASRDSIESKSIDLLTDDVNFNVGVYMSKYNLQDMSDYNKSLTKCVYSRDPHWELEDYFDDQTNNITSALNTRYKEFDNGTTPLTDMLARGGTLVALKSLRKDLMTALENYIDGTITFFRIPTRLSDEERGHRIALFKELNIILGEQFKKDNKISEKRSNTTRISGGKTVSYSENRSIILNNSIRGNHDTSMFGERHGWRAGSNKYSTTIGAVNENTHNYMLSVDPKRFEQSLNINNQYTNDWKIMHTMKGLSEDIITFDKLMVKVANTMYQTNNGLVKGSELMSDWRIIVGDDIDLLDGVETFEETDQDVRYIMVKSINDVVELRWYEEIERDDKVFKLEVDEDGTNLSSAIIEYEEYVSFVNDNSTRRSDRLLRMYWVKKKLPRQYANIFLHAIQNVPEHKIPEIEQTARELDLELNK
tara:strand:- start:3652 stop:6015 length:2364 start_codon:yes stop_codon:yes gene_type:complete